VTHLLDANALIALAWPRHEHHDITQTWFKRHAREGWATSALTQSAFVRIVSQPAFAGQAIAISDVAELLLRNTAHPHHVFLALDFGFEQVLGSCTGGLHGHRQVTDAYLLTLAMRNKAKLLTFDGGLPQLLASPQERQKHITLLA
jgi:toxin-antitoxin system PIN domain toxin